MTTKWITKKEKPKSWITKKKTTNWITKKKKPTGWITKKPTTKSTLTGTGKEHGGGPDSGNIGYNKDFIYRAGKHRKNKPEWIKRKQPERIMAPYRAKHGIGSIVKGAKKIISKVIKPKGAFKPEGKVDQRFLDFIKTGKHVDKHGVKVNVPKAAERLTGKPHVDHGKRKKIKHLGKGKAGGGRAGFQHGGRTNLLEELGRVEAEPSNRNRRAEISRVHGELNKGYKSGGAVLKGKKVGIQIK